MNNIKKFPKKKISDLYPLILSDKVPKVYESQIISYKTKEINEYHLGIWHRFLVKFYGQATEIDSFLCKAKDHHPILNENSRCQTVCEATFRYFENSKIIFLNVNSENLQKYADGLLTIEPVFRDWRYFFELPSASIISIGSKDNHTAIYISLVNPDDSNKKGINEEVKKFIYTFLEEMKKQNNNLLNPKKMFNEKKVFCYTLWNVYLSNYSSAEHIIQMADREEKKIDDDLHKFSNKSVMLEEGDASAHTESALLVCGVFYSSAISYLFMALEGFINIIFHCFVKQDINDLDMERGLNIEQKIRLMPHLCEGFTNDFNEVASETYKKFLKLKNYRNQLFHSKIEDSLHTVQDYYQCFFYNYQMDEYKNNFLPSYKMKLTQNDVLQVKKIVDKMIEDIFNAMDKTTQNFTKKHILNSSAIPFMKSFEETNPLLKLRK